MPHCHLASLYQESAFGGGIPRKTGASRSKLYRHVANSLAGRGKVIVEGSSKGRKIMPGSWPGKPVRSGLLPLRFINLPRLAVIFRNIPSPPAKSLGEVWRTSKNSSILCASVAMEATAAAE